MRKLLLSSQKGGVGKTTTSINLAAGAALAGARVLLLDADPLSSVSNSLGLARHPGRQLLRAAGLDLPGTFVADLVPGLDVLSPYEDGGCSDEELDALLGLLDDPALAECYNCLILDTPPFLGASPAQLLGTCDEFVLVMRAESMASRTLPAFLELVQRSGKPIKLRGILLTLPEGEDVGGRWERELRGRFGTRILSHVVPHDEAVSQAQLFGQVVGQAHPEAASSRAYQGLAESLGLAAQARPRPGPASGISALLVASASRKQAAPARKQASRKVKRPEAPRAPLAPATPPSPPPAERPARDHQPGLAGLPEPVRRRLTPAAPPPVVAAARAAPALPEAPPAPPAPRPKRPRPQAASPPPKPFPPWLAVLGIGVAIGVGVGLRFLQLPENVTPLLAGVAVASAVVVGLRGLGGAAGPPAAAPARGARPAGDSVKRLGDLARRSKTPTGREVSEN